MSIILRHRGAIFFVGTLVGETIGQEIMKTKDFLARNTGNTDRKRETDKDREKMYTIYFYSIRLEFLNVRDQQLSIINQKL